MDGFEAGYRQIRRSRPGRAPDHYVNGARPRARRLRRERLQGQAPAVLHQTGGHQRCWPSRQGLVAVWSPVAGATEVTNALRASYICVPDRREIAVSLKGRGGRPDRGQSCNCHRSSLLSSQVGMIDLALGMVSPLCCSTLIRLDDRSPWIGRGRRTGRRIAVHLLNQYFVRHRTFGVGLLSAPPSRSRSRTD